MRNISLRTGIWASRVGGIIPFLESSDIVCIGFGRVIYFEKSGGMVCRLS